MAQQTDSVSALREDTRSEGGLSGFLSGLTMHKNVGLDAEGYSHFHNVEEGIAIVCEGDRRFKGIRDDDVVQTHIFAGDRDIEDYVKFVQDGHGWVDLRDDLELRVFGKDGIPADE